MKFTFKIQKYQTEEVDSLVKCFEGQQFADKGLMSKLEKQEYCRFLAKCRNEPA